MIAILTEIKDYFVTYKAEYKNSNNKIQTLISLLNQTRDTPLQGYLRNEIKKLVNSEIIASDSMANPKKSHFTP
jgi:hypothetical protein